MAVDMICGSGNIRSVDQSGLVTQTPDVANAQGTYQSILSFSSLMPSTTSLDSQTVRQPLHLYIDTYPYQTTIHISPGHGSTSPSSSSHASPGTAGTSPTGGFDSAICYVLCMYDFDSDDLDHLPFRKNEILDIVRQEDTGWWAAMRKDHDQIGWIPQAFVNKISDAMAEKLRNTRPELRRYEYDAEQLYLSAPTQQIPLLYESEDGITNSRKKRRQDGRSDLRTQPQYRKDSRGRSPRGSTQHTSISISGSTELSFPVRNKPPPPSPLTPMPLPSTYRYKPTPPTPPPSQESIPQREGRGRSDSLPTQIPGKRPSTADEARATQRLAVLPEFIDLRNVRDHSEVAKPMRPEKWQKVMGLDHLLNNVEPQPHVPWYLQPTFVHHLEMAQDGTVLRGSLDALVERLSLDVAIRDPIRMAQDNAFRNTFLMTFRTFMTADALFDMLVERYRMDHPDSLTSVEFENWRKHLVATQRRVLLIFTMWLEDHRLLEEEPHIAQRLTEFLGLIVSTPLSSEAKLLLQVIERLTFASPAITSPVSPRRPRKSKAFKNDLLKLEPADVAEQLALLEYKRYVKLTPQECLRQPPSTPQANSNLSAFCSTHDKLVSWVKTSILNNDPLGKRADTIEFWIKVAEKCKTLNNFASMSAIINALSSAVITRLHLTWAHVSRKPALDVLLRYGEPTRSFSGYRSLLNNVEGPCVPFIGMFLTDIVHIHDMYSDTGGRICFLQRHKWYEIVSAMLRYQSRQYDIAESESTMKFILSNLREDPNKDQNWFWARSHDVQQSELAHADIRKGLEAAGF